MRNYIQMDKRAVLVYESSKCCHVNSDNSLLSYHFNL